MRSARDLASSRAWIAILACTGTLALAQAFLAAPDNAADAAIGAFLLTSAVHRIITRLG